MSCSNYTVLRHRLTAQGNFGYNDYNHEQLLSSYNKLCHHEVNLQENKTT